MLLWAHIIPPTPPSYCAGVIFFFVLFFACFFAGFFSPFCVFGLRRGSQNRSKIEKNLIKITLFFRSPFFCYFVKVFDDVCMIFRRRNLDFGWQARRILHIRKKSNFSLQAPLGTRFSSIFDPILEPKIEKNRIWDTTQKNVDFWYPFFFDLIFLAIVSWFLSLFALFFEAETLILAGRRVGFCISSKNNIFHCGHLSGLDFHPFLVPFWSPKSWKIASRTRPKKT